MNLSKIQIQPAILAQPIGRNRFRLLDLLKRFAVNIFYAVSGLWKSERQALKRIAVGLDQAAHEIPAVAVVADFED